MDVLFMLDEYIFALVTLKQSLVMFIMRYAMKIIGFLFLHTGRHSGKQTCQNCHRVYS